MIYATFRAGDRVEWNPTGDTWEPATVHKAAEDHAMIVLDENSQTLLVSPQNLRRLDDAGDPVVVSHSTGSP